MDMENLSPSQQRVVAGGTIRRRSLLLICVTLMVLGGTGGPLFTRIYFLHGGARIWLTSLLENIGFPIAFLPLVALYSHRQQRRTAAGVFSVTGWGAAACVALGVLSGPNAFMYAYGSASLPVSTSSLLISTQLAFTAGFALLIVGQRFTPYSVNAVVLLVTGSVILGLQSAGDRPAGESSARYYLGFFMMLGAAATSGLLMPLIELTCMRMKGKVTFALVMEMQAVVSAAASAFCAVGMLVNKDFQAIRREAKEYGLGETKYYLVLVACGIFWQLLNLGFVGVISFSSSLLAGIVQAVLLPVGEILPVFVLNEKFNSGKGVALALCLWGFTSYLYGEHQHHKKRKEVTDQGLELPAAP